MGKSWCNKEKAPTFNALGIEPPGNGLKVGNFEGLGAVSTRFKFNFPFLSFNLTMLGCNFISHGCNLVSHNCNFVRLGCNLVGRDCNFVRLGINFASLGIDFTALAAPFSRPEAHFSTSCAPPGALAGHLAAHPVDFPCCDFNFKPPIFPCAALKRKMGDFLPRSKQIANGMTARAGQL